MIIACPRCNNDFDNKGKWGIRKFCSQACANARVQTEEMREKKRIKLQVESRCIYCSTYFSSKGNAARHERKCIMNTSRSALSIIGGVGSEITKRKQGRNNVMGQRVPISLLDMSKRTVSKVLIRLGIGCSNCGWKESSCDVHHIVPRKQGGTDDNNNLTVLCPNCHRLAHTDKLHRFTSVPDQIGDLWREHYYAHANE